MIFRLADGQEVRIDTPFTYNGVRYPAEWLRQMSPADREAFGAVELPEPIAPVTPAPPVVPSSLTPLQARKALRAAGIKEQVDALLAAAPENVQEEWEYAITIERNNPTLLATAAQLNMTPEQIDAIFINGATL